MAYHRLFMTHIFVALMLFVGCVGAVQAQGVRDAEIERLLKDYSRPLLLAAGLDPKRVGIGIINNRKLNAFVAGGQNIFFHTGLILEADEPNMIIGVMAHEIGHITGGHLARTSGVAARIQRPALIATILGFGSILTGAPNIGLALITGSQQLAQRSFLSYSRGQEAAADITALKLLESTQQSPNGIIELMNTLAGQEALQEDNQDPYVQSHPLSRDRVAIYEKGAADSPYRTRKDAATLKRRHALVKAKIHGFLERPEITLRRYERDTALTGRYARAIAHHRQGSTNKALELIDGAIAMRPKNPFFHELKGQIACESGRASIGIAPYKAAVRLLPDEALFYVGLAGCQVEWRRADTTVYKAALKNLRTALRLAPDTVSAYFLMAKVYGQLERIAYAEWALAEYYALRHNPKATIHAKRAVKGLPENSVESVRAHDILALASNGKKRKVRNKK